MVFNPALMSGQLTYLNSPASIQQGSTRGLQLCEARFAEGAVSWCGSQLLKLQVPSLLGYPEGSQHLQAAAEDN
jgi:hypothetical protein